jgi:hypothetical protein
MMTTENPALNLYRQKRDEVLKIYWTNLVWSYRVTGVMYMKHSKHNEMMNHMKQFRISWNFKEFYFKGSWWSTETKYIERNEEDHIVNVLAFIIAYVDSRDSLPYHIRHYASIHFVEKELQTIVDEAVAECIQAANNHPYVDTDSTFGMLPEGMVE